MSRKQLADDSLIWAGRWAYGGERQSQMPATPGGEFRFQETNVPFLRDRFDDDDETVISDGRPLRAGVRGELAGEGEGGAQTAGTPSAGEGVTMDISAHGCMAVVPEQFELGETLMVTNLINQKECEAVLIWRGHQATSGWEFRVAAT